MGSAIGAPYGWGNTGREPAVRSIIERWIGFFAVPDFEPTLFRLRGKSGSLGATRATRLPWPDTLLGEDSLFPSEPRFRRLSSPAASNSSGKGLGLPSTRGSFHTFQLVCIAWLTNLSIVVCLFLTIYGIRKPVTQKACQLPASRRIRGKAGD
jgi:hypothetical protein